MENKPMTKEEIYGRLSRRDPFDGVPRVPHTDGAGIQIGPAGIPPNRIYPRGAVVEDYREAAANYVKRKQGVMPPIPGGIDDEDPALYNNPGGSSPFGKMRVAQGRAPTAEEVERLKQARHRKAEHTEHAEHADQPEQLGHPAQAVLVVQPVQPVQPDREKEARAQAPSAPAKTLDPPVWSDGHAYGQEAHGGGVGWQGGPFVQDVPQPAPAPGWTPGGAGTPQVVYRDRIIERPVEKTVEKIVEKETPGHEWLKRRIRVQIATSETTFNVSAIDIMRSGRGITVILPTDNGAMTFVPRIGAKVTLSAQAFPETDTLFTGVSFDIEALGMFGLCFLVPKEQVREQDAQS